MSATLTVRAEGKPLPVRQNQSQMRVWTALALIVSVALFVAALRTDVYVATSPPARRRATGPWHVFARKVYSVVAFAGVAYLFGRSRTERGLATPLGLAVAVLALYSTAIEIGQFLLGSHEGIWWNLIDIGCGALGGILGVAALRIRFGPHRS
jgi:hypothetical protein